MQETSAPGKTYFDQIPKNEAKVYQEAEFPLGLKDIILTYPGCCLAFASSLDVFLLDLPLEVFTAFS